MRTSSIRLRANARLAILHEDYLEICDGNMLAAMLLSILIYWTDIKISKKDENLWVWKSHQDFQEDLMFDKPGMKPPHRTTIKTAIDLLLKKKFIEWRRNPKMQLDQTRQYLVDAKAVQKAIDALPPIVVKPTMQCQNNDNAMLENRQSLSENRQCNVEKPTSNTNDYYTEITNSEITEGTFVGTSADDANAPASDNVIDWKTASGKMRAIKLSEHTPGAGTRSLAVAPNSGQDDSTSVQAIPVPPVIAEQAAIAPVASASSLSPNGVQRGARKGKAMTQAIEPDVLVVIERWSEAMKKTYPLTDALLKAATLLAPCNPSVDDLKKVRGFCFTSNPKWFRDERKGAVTLLDVAKNWEAWQSSLETPQAVQDHRTTNTTKPAVSGRDLRLARRAI